MMFQVPGKVWTHLDFSQSSDGDLRRKDDRLGVRPSDLVSVRNNKQSHVSPDVPDVQRHTAGSAAGRLGLTDPMLDSVKVPPLRSAVPS